MFKNYFTYKIYDDILVFGVRESGDFFTFFIWHN